MAPTKSAKETRRAARAALKNARHSGEATGLDAMEFEQVDDVYETMNEEQYTSYVEGKRDREDFVVDDGKKLRGLSLLLMYNCWGGGVGGGGVGGGGGVIACGDTS